MIKTIFHYPLPSSGKLKKLAGPFFRLQQYLLELNIKFSPLVRNEAYNNFVGGSSLSENNGIFDF